MKLSSDGFNNKVELLKKKWNNVTITKGTLRAMLLDALKQGFKKAVVFAKKKQDKYKKDTLLVYRKNPIIISTPDNIFSKSGKLWAMYIMLPEEIPPKEVDIKPNSECVFSEEEEVPLEDPKEIGVRVEEIIKALEYTPLAKPDIIPQAPPGDNYMYFFDRKNDEMINPATPVNFVPPGAYENTYKSASWHGTLNGVQIQPVDPHSPCYYQIMCCGNKPSPDARSIIKNYFKKRSSYFFNMKSIGIINAIGFLSKSQKVSSSTAPPDIKTPIYPVPGAPGRYPVPNLKIGGYSIGIKGRIPTPLTQKPIVSGGQGPKGILSGERKGTSMKSYEINKGRYAQSPTNSVVSGNGLNTRKRARTNAFKRGTWYNNQGKLGQQTSLKVAGGEPKYIEDKSNFSGLIGTSDIAQVVIDLPTNRTGLGTAREKIDTFRETSNVLKAYGYYFTDPLAPASDVDFGTAATQQYIDNLFFYPYDNKFGKDTYIDFFVKFKGSGVKLTPVSETDFYFAIIGQNNTSLPAFADTFGTGKQSLGIADTVNNVVLEIRMRYESLLPTNGLFSAQVRCVSGNGVVITAPVIVTSPPIRDIVRGAPLHVRLRLRTRALGTAAAALILNSDFVIGSRVYSMPAYTSTIGVTARELTKLAFGYIDYENPILTTPALSGRIPALSAGANLTGLQLSTKRISRKYVWDYTKLSNI